MSVLALSERDSRLAESGRKTLAEELRLQLADEIIRGTLAPGAPLDETDIARRFSVSRTPVRRTSTSRAATAGSSSR